MQAKNKVQIEKNDLPFNCGMKVETLSFFGSVWCIPRSCFGVTTVCDKSTHSLANSCLKDDSYHSYADDIQLYIFNPNKPPTTSSYQAKTYSFQCACVFNRIKPFSFFWLWAQLSSFIGGCKELWEGVIELGDIV